MKHSYPKRRYSDLALGDRRYDDLAALAARQDRRTDRRLTIDILVREARRGNSQGRKPVAVQLRHLLPAPPLAALDPRFPRTVDHQLRDIIRFQTREERSEEHTSELQPLMRTSYAAFCLKKKPTP